MSIIDETLDGLFAFGRVVRSVQTAGKNVLLYLQGDRDPNGNVERHDQQAPWFISPILYRPAAPQDERGEEAFFLRRGNEAIIIGTRDLRWQVDLVDGEVVIRALSDRASRIRLRPDGSVVIEAERVEVKGPGSAAPATHRLVTEDALKQHLLALVTSLATGSNGGGTVVFATPYSALTVNGADFGSKRISVDQ